MAEEWTELACADDDCLSDELLSWSGYSEVWDIVNHEGTFDFFADVFEDCEAQFVEEEEWEEGGPGLSGVYRKVTSNAPELLRAQVLGRILFLSFESECPLRPATISPYLSTPAIEALLHSLADSEDHGRWRAGGPCRAAAATVANIGPIQVGTARALMSLARHHRSTVVCEAARFMTAAIVHRLRAEDASPG